MFRDVRERKQGCRPEGRRYANQDSRRGFSAPHRGGLSPARPARRHAPRTLAVAPRASRRRRTRRLAARARRRPRLAAAAHCTKIRQTHRAPRLAPRRCLDALLQKIDGNEVKEIDEVQEVNDVKEVKDLEQSGAHKSAGRAEIFSFTSLTSFTSYLSGGSHGTRCTSKHAANDRR